MVVAEAVAAMAATPAAIEVNLTIVFVLFVSADVILTGKKEMKAHTSKMDSYSSSIYTHAFISHHYLNDSLTDAHLAPHIFSISHLSHNLIISMEMLLFLNESYIFHRFRMWSIVLWHSCVFVCAECGNANYRGAGVP